MVESAGKEADGTAARLPAGVWLAALLFVVLHLLPQPGYGFHRDELLYLAMGDHLELFRMQFPPMIAILAQTARALPLDLLPAVRLLAALAGTSILLLTALLCRAMGGGPRAQIIAGTAILVSPLFLRAGTLFQPVVFEQLWWTVGALAMTQLLAGRDRRWWLVLGAAVGLGALTKFSVAFLGAGLAVAVLSSPLRLELRTRWPWLGLLLAILLALPSLMGQVTWEWPFLVQINALRANQLTHVDHLSFFLEQFEMLGAAAGFWLIGLLALLLWPALRRFRPLGVLAATVFLLLFLGNGKAYYFGPMLPVLLAAGVIWLGSVIPLRWRGRAFAGALAGMAAGGMLLLPDGIPLLPPAEMARYATRLGITHAEGQALRLPPDYADMTGWPELVQTVATVYDSLSPGERDETVILGVNYGRTGAIAALGPHYRLPYPISLHGDFHAWGPGDLPGAVTIVVGGSMDDLEEYCGSVTIAARVRNPWGVEEERDVPIYLCRNPQMPLRELFRLMGPIWG